ncbi:PH domain-containing protein [Kitasatospora sp. NBC_00240]|uniref:PH domain-containing protein n=1 Tax=Kitasatospora sp. NBC_00240 TaxID=2903567 RepID=UPI00225A3E80|nr:PH domain-containing protein [Kitasatospora sp. NBC_00240]MCX5213161.1 PH domain-containing protein [Kitasatospora sp. NBC_00240]
MPAEPTPTLRPPRHRVDRRARRWWTAQALLTVSGPMLLTALVLGVLTLLFFPGALPWLGPLLLGALVVPALVYTVAMPRGRYAVHAWELGAHAVHTAHGWLWQRARIAPLTRVQTVDTVRGPVQRRFGLATVIVTTASTAGSIKIAGLADADAKELARRITDAARTDQERWSGSGAAAGDRRAQGAPAALVGTASPAGTGGMP